MNHHFLCLFINKRIIEHKLNIGDIDGVIDGISVWIYIRILLRAIFGGFIVRLLMKQVWFIDLIYREKEWKLVLFLIIYFA